MTEAFHRLAFAAAKYVGSPWAFLAAVALIAVWALTGPFFDYNETWQLVINTTTTIITFIMVFLIQATQNRESKALHLKLDELIRSSSARDVFADLEEAGDAEIEAFEQEFRELRARGASHVEATIGAHEQVLGSERKSEQPKKGEGNQS